MDAADYLVQNCIEEQRKHILVLYDRTTKDIAVQFYYALKKNGKDPKLQKIRLLERHGEEPPAGIAEVAAGSDAVMCITRYSLAHTKVRKQMEDSGKPFLSMPAYDDSMLHCQAMFADYKKILPQVKYYADILTRGKTVKIFSESGTSLFLDIQNRRGNCCPGLTNHEYLLGSPPDIEANISPVETNTNGKIVVDGSVTDGSLGVLSSPVVLEVEDGFVKNIQSAEKEAEYTVKKMFWDAGSQKAYVIGEFGIGFNDCAVLCGNMLVDEGARGCIHFGAGSNWTIGGNNQVDFHLDFVVRNCTVQIDGKTVIEKGDILYG